MTEIKVNTDRKEFKVIENSKDEPSLEQAQKFVGGYVEGISFPNGDYLIINEEGRLKKLPLNPEATLRARGPEPNPKIQINFKPIPPFVQRGPTTIGCIA